MPNLFSPRINALMWWPVGVLLLSALLIVLALLFLPRSDYITLVNITVVQPVPFSHRHHVSGLGLDCRYCHASAETVANAGMPTQHVCMTCHSQIWTQADVLRPLYTAYTEGRSLTWVRLHDLADYAYFDHGTHIQHGVGCTECHGHVESMPSVFKSNSLYMEWCLQCHRAPASQVRQAQLMHTYRIDNSGLTDCYICHR